MKTPASETTNSNSAAVKKQGLRKNKKVFLKCESQDNGQGWSTDNEQCSNCLLFELSPLPNGKLTTLQVVLGYFFEKRRMQCVYNNDEKKRSYMVDKLGQKVEIPERLSSEKEEEHALEGIQRVFIKLQIFV